MTTLPDPQTAFDVPSFRPEMAFPCFTEDMISCIRNYGTEVEYDNGTQISTAGQREADKFVILTGSIQVYTVDDRSQLEPIIAYYPEIRMCARTTVFADQRHLERTVSLEKRSRSNR
jgi:hypothetical protein